MGYERSDYRIALSGVRDFFIRKKRENKGRTGGIKVK